MRDVDKQNVTTDVFRDLVDEQRIVYNWQQIETKRSRRSFGLPEHRWVYAAALMLMLAGTGVTLLLSNDTISRPVPLSFELSESTRMFAVPSRATTERSIPLSDGSTITMAPGASLEVEDNAPTRFRTSQHKGWVRYNVVPDKNRTWEIDTGLCRIRVLGTQFTINRTPQYVRISVHRGTVAVYPPTGDDVLATPTAGKTYTVRSPKQKTPKRPAVLSPVEDITPEPAQPAARPSPKTRRSSRAVKRPDASGMSSPKPRISATTLSGLGASEEVNVLLEKVDKARLRNQPQRAAALLDRILREHPADPTAGLVALTLGNIRLDTLQQPRAAARAFKKAAHSRGLPVSLREQALARSVEAFRRAGNIAAAQDMGRKYRRRFPRGVWLSWIERWTNAD